MLTGGQRQALFALGRDLTAVARELTVIKHAVLRLCRNHWNTFLIWTLSTVNMTSRRDQETVAVLLFEVAS